MIFKVTRTDLENNEKPCRRAKEFRFPFGQKEVLLWVVDIETIDELLDFVAETGAVIIPKNADRFPRLEIANYNVRAIERGLKDIKKLLIEGYETDEEMDNMYDKVMSRVYDLLELLEEG